MFAAPAEGEEDADRESSEVEKLKGVLRQMLKDKAQLKEELAKEIAAHEADVNQWCQEQAKLKERFGKMAEEIANQPRAASPEQVAQIEALELQMSRLESDIRNVRLKHEEAKINREVLQKQVKQYMASVENIQSEISEADDEQRRLAIQKTRISTLEDEVRKKSETINELKTNMQWIDREIEKVSQKLSSSGKHVSVMSLNRFSVASIEATPVSIDDSVRKCFQEMRGTELDCENPNMFIAELANNFKRLENENEQLMQQSAKLRRQHAKLVGLKPTTKQEVSPQELKEAALKLAESNRHKAEKISKLKDIVTRQYKALQKVVGSPTSDAALSLAFRNTIAQLATCPLDERQMLVSQGERILDAMQGVLE